jgi:hypothetical protein
MRCNEKNGNIKWQDAIALELLQINEYETFTDVENHTKAKIQNPYYNNLSDMQHLMTGKKHTSDSL